MRVFYCNDFTGHWPVGTAAVIVAKDAGEAETLLRLALEADGLAERNTGEIRINELKTEAPSVILLCNGVY